MLSVSNYYS